MYVCMYICVVVMYWVLHTYTYKVTIENWMCLYNIIISFFLFFCLKNLESHGHRNERKIEKREWFGINSSFCWSQDYLIAKFANYIEVPTHTYTHTNLTEKVKGSQTICKTICT